MIHAEGSHAPSTDLRTPATRGASNVFEKIFSFPVTLAASLVLLAFLSVIHRMNDSDTWWHLKMGQVVWTTHKIPTTDIFSFTTNHHAWVPHEWLAQLSLYVFYLAGGYRGIMLWLFLLTAAVFVSGYLLCTIYSGNAKTALAGALTLWLFSTAGLSPRPQLLGYLLMVVELLLLELGRTRSARWLFGLPFLFALWVNIHGSFSFGMIILAVTLACSYVSGDWGLIVSRAWNARARKVLALCSGLSVLALAINPDGVHQILYPIDVLVNQPVLLRVVEEWLPLTISSPRGLGLFVTIGIIALIILINRSAIRIEEIALLALATFSALAHRRLAFVFGVIAAPIVARLLAPLWDRYDPREDKPWLNAGIVLAILAGIYASFPSQARLEQIVNDDNPSRAVSYIREHHLSGPMLNAFDFGGYLIWALPEQPVFIDGRVDVYEWTGVMAEMEQWVSQQEDPNVLLNRYNIQFCLLENGSMAARIVSSLPNWKEVYSDRLSVIFTRVH